MDEIKKEIIQENGHNIIRYYCIEGFIDLYSGSQDPNYPIRDQHVNHNIYLFRLNGKGDWYNNYHFRRPFKLVLEEQYTRFDSNLIWNDHLKDHKFIRYD